MSVIKNPYFKKMYNNLNNIHDEIITKPNKATYSLSIIILHTINDIKDMDLGLTNDKKTTDPDNLVSFFVRYMMAHDETMLIDNRWQEFNFKNNEIIKYANEAYTLIKYNKMNDTFMTIFMTTLKLMY